MGALAEQLFVGNCGGTVNPVTLVASAATGCNPAYSVTTAKDAVMMVSVSMIEGRKPLSGSIEVYSETGASWIYCGSRLCRSAEHLELEVRITASASPYIVLPALGAGSGYKLDIAATEEVTVRPMSCQV